MQTLPQKIDDLYTTMLNLSDSFQNESYRESFLGFMARMDQIHSFSSVGKYRVVFIGLPGDGKTTAICNWLQLLKEEKTEKIDNAPLLATSAGRTTVAEIHIRQTDEQTNLQLNYLPDIQQKELIRDFCSYYYRTGLGIESENSDEASIEVHIEYYRAIRNMAGLRELNKGISEKAQIIQQRITSFLSEFENEEKFTEYVIDTIDVESRKCDQILYTREEPFEKWINKNFNAINDGKNPACGLPRKVYVNISKDDLDMKIPEYISEVIDTKGLDTSARDDLQELLKAEDTICFVINRITDVPSMAARILLSNTFLSEWARYYIQKTSIFVRCSETDLENVKDAADDPEEGKSIKLSMIEAIMLGQKIPYKTTNTIFIDACKAYNLDIQKIPVVDDEGEPVINPVTGLQKTKKISVLKYYDEEDAFEYTATLNYHIKGMIDHLRGCLQSDADDVRIEVEKLVALEKEYEDKQAKKELVNIRRHLEEERSSFIDRFRKYDGAGINEIIIEKTVKVHRRTWKRMDKINRLHGGYKTWTPDIYTEIAQIGRSCFATQLKPVEDELKKILIDVRNQNARTVTGGYIETLEEVIDKEIRHVGEEFLNWALKSRFATEENDYIRSKFDQDGVRKRLDKNNQFWDKVDYQKIGGKGYMDRVEKMYHDHIYKDCGDLAALLWDEVNVVIDRVIECFPQD